jgi:dipeptidyl aminopeptidase/acylaminoacyl peptidase
MRSIASMAAALAGGCVLLALVAAPPIARSQPEPSDLQKKVDALQQQVEDQRYTTDQILKRLDDVLWFDRVGDVADLDKVYLTGPPNPKETPTYGIANERHPFRFWAYTFVPKKLGTKKAPLLVLPHGGVHGDFTTYHTHIIRELMELGYVVIAPEYRGSTGYGKGYEQAIDYGGLEVGDCVAARDWAVANLPNVDGSRVGIIGWSHGGLIALMSVFDHPEKFQVCYAGVPVSDIVSRMGYQTDDYRDLYSARYHIGKTANQDVDEYRRRSPAWNASKLRTPLLIHTNTNDRDVNSIEVEELIAQLKAANKQFEYKIYKDAPGGHSFNRMDTDVAHESRREIWAFLGKHLK